LLALLFVAVSLGTGFLTEARSAATRTFFSPIIIHFAVVLFLSAVALAPSSRLFYVLLISGSGLVGLVTSVVPTVQFMRHDWTPYLVDRLDCGLLPAIGYVALIVAAALLQTGYVIALHAFAGALLLLLLVNIRNAWDLMLCTVRRHQGPG